MTKAFRKMAREALALRTSQYTNRFELIPSSKWPLATEAKQIEVHMSRKFLVQVFAEDGGYIRLSVTRCELGKGRTFADGISWDELQDIKRDLGYGDRFAVEAYPEDKHTINVANMRHLWIFPDGERLGFAWRKANG